MLHHAHSSTTRRPLVLNGFLQLSFFFFLKYPFSIIKRTCMPKFLHFSFYSPHPSIHGSQSQRYTPLTLRVFFCQPSSCNHKEPIMKTISLCLCLPGTICSSIHAALVDCCSRLLCFSFFLSREKKKKLLICQINVVFLVRMPYFRCIGGSPEQALSVIFARRHKRIPLLSRNTPSYFFLFSLWCFQF